MRVLGVDPSTYTGLALIAEHTYTKVLNYPGELGIKRLASLEHGFGEFLDSHCPDLVVIEGYGYGNKFTAVMMGEIGATLRLCLHRRGILWYTCPPSVLKKYVTGNGASTKAKVAAAVKIRWGFETSSDDVVDAYVLAQIGRQLALTGISGPLKGVTLN